MVRFEAGEVAPLVSIFCFCKNDVRNIRSCIDSILDQSYPHLEIVVQDGASTDGTLEALRSYGDRISVISEPDKSPQDAFYKALRRCQGDIIGSCLCDEKLLREAAELAVQEFRLYPECGGIYGDTLIAEPGKPLWRKKERKPFSVYAYLSREAHFHFCSFFMRRSALETVGLHTRPWRSGAAEFELVSRLGLSFPIRHISEIFSIYTLAPQGLSQQPANINAFAESMESFLEELCAEPACPLEIKTAKDQIHSILALKTAEALLPHTPKTAELLFAKAGLHTPDPVSYFKFRRRFQKIVRRTPKGPFWGPWKKWMVRGFKKILSRLA